MTLSEHIDPIVKDLTFLKKIKVFDPCFNPALTTIKHYDFRQLGQFKGC